MMLWSRSSISGKGAQTGQVLGLVFCIKSKGDAEQCTRQHLVMEDLTGDMCFRRFCSHYIVFLAFNNLSYLRHLHLKILYDFNGLFFWKKQDWLFFFLLSSLFLLSNCLKDDQAPEDPPYALRETQKKPHLTCQRQTRVASRRPGSPDICCVRWCLIYLRGKQGRRGRESAEPLSLHSSLFILQTRSFEIWDVQKMISMANKKNFSDIAHNTISFPVNG